MSQGAGLINFARTFGGAAGVNLMVVFLESRTADHAQTISDSQTPDNSAAQDLLAHIIALMQDSGVSAIDSSAGALRYLGETVFAQAQTQGFQDTFMLTALIAALALLPAHIMGRGFNRG